MDDVMAVEVLPYDTYLETHKAAIAAAAFVVPIVTYMLVVVLCICWYKINCTFFCDLLLGVFVTCVNIALIIVILSQVFFINDNWAKVVQRNDWPSVHLLVTNYSVEVVPSSTTHCSVTSCNSCSLANATVLPCATVLLSAEHNNITTSGNQTIPCNGGVACCSRNAKDGQCTAGVFGQLCAVRCGYFNQVNVRLDYFTDDTFTVPLHKYFTVQLVCDYLAPLCIFTYVPGQRLEGYQNPHNLTDVRQEYDDFGKDAEVIYIFCGVFFGCSLPMQIFFASIECRRRQRSLWSMYFAPRFADCFAGLAGLVARWRKRWQDFHFRTPKKEKKQQPAAPAPAHSITCIFCVCNCKKTGDARQTDSSDV